MSTDDRRAVATLISTEGTAPREPGAKMWLDADGRVIGSVTIGGCVDARVIEESGRVLRSGEPVLLSLALGDEDAWALGMTCGGTVEVLIEPVSSLQGDPVARTMRAVDEAIARGLRAVVVVPLGGALERMVIRDSSSSDAVSGTLGAPALDRAAADAARELFATGVTGTRTIAVEGTAHRLYLELHAPPATLVVFGATHVAMPLVAMAKTLGLRTVVVDGRERFATRERFPEADELIVGMPSEIAERLPLGETSAVVLLSHDYKYDLPVLRAVLQSDAAYIGVLGSAKRGGAMLDFLREDGVGEEQLARVRIPVGLDIGAKRAAEIALSVLAEIVALRTGKPGTPMRDRPRRDGTRAPMSA